MHKKLLTKEVLHPKMIEGLTKIAAMVKRTLGPGGLPIIIQRTGQALNGDPLGPKITKDGVSVAKECSDKDPEQDLIIQAVKNICQKTNSSAGDGTTTAIVLGEAIVKETLKILESDKTLNPQLVKESLEAECKLIIEELKKSAIKISDYERIKQVATISANGDEEIGEIIGEAFKHVGAEGVVTVDEGSSNNTTLDIVEGYQINRGAEARDRFFNNQDLTKFEAENAALIIYDGKLLNYTEIIPVLQTLAGVNEQGQPTKPMPPVVFMANEFSNEVIQFLLIQKAERGMQFCCIKGPHMTYVRTGYYDDIAIMSGGSRLGNGNKSMSAFEDGDEGLVKRIIVDKYKTLIYEGQGDEDEILSRVDQLKALKANAESPYDAQVVSDRIAALTGGVAKIGVGGSTEFEIKEKYDRIEDALNAARAAIEEGIVAGGGTTLLRVANKLKNLKIRSVGQTILKNALEAPFRQILENIGEDQVDDLMETLLDEDDNLVYDARNKKVVDALDAGIIDPVKVTRTALENAVSIASLLSTAGGGIIFVKD